MDESTRSRIRYIFLSPRPNFALTTAADLLGMTLKELKREIEDGRIVAVSTALGQRITREELVAVAMEKWEQSVIEEALGKDATTVLPEAIRLVELRARVPRYQRDVLRALARREGTSVDAVLTREPEDVACSYRDELVASVPELAAALAWADGVMVVRVENGPEWVFGNKGRRSSSLPPRFRPDSFRNRLIPI
jgi:hypothetical protein